MDYAQLYFYSEPISGSTYQQSPRLQPYSITGTPRSTPTHYSSLRHTNTPPPLPPLPPSPRHIPSYYSPSYIGSGSGIGGLTPIGRSYRSYYQPHASGSVINFGRISPAAAHTGPLLATSAAADFALPPSLAQSPLHYLPPLKDPSLLPQVPVAVLYGNHNPSVHTGSYLYRPHRRASCLSADYPPTILAPPPSILKTTGIKCKSSYIKDIDIDDDRGELEITKIIPESHITGDTTPPPQPPTATKPAELPAAELIDTTPPNQQHSPLASTTHLPQHFDSCEEFNNIVDDTSCFNQKRMMVSKLWNNCFPELTHTHVHRHNFYLCQVCITALPSPTLFKTNLILLFSVAKKYPSAYHLSILSLDSSNLVFGSSSMFSA